MVYFGCYNKFNSNNFIIIPRGNVTTGFCLLGISAGLSWIVCLRFLRYFDLFYILIKTLTRAVPKCLQFVVGVSPVLIGYALIGSCLFYHSPFFETIPRSFATLFSLMNGDIVSDSFEGTMERYRTPSWVRCISTLSSPCLSTWFCIFSYQSSKRRTSL